MKITPTDTYLSLVLEALDSILLPEMQSADAKATAAVVRAILTELRRRENDSPRLLRSHIAEGHAIVARMAAVLGEAVAENAAAPDEHTAFATLIDAHATLLADMARLSQQLAVQRPPGDDAAQTTASVELMHQGAVWERACYEQLASSPPLPVLPRAAKPPGAPLTRQLFESFMQSQHPDGKHCVVTAFEPIPGGFSKQTFRASVRDARGSEQPLIIRKNAPILSLAYGGFMIDHEFHLLQDVHASGLPVAQPLYLGIDVAGVDSDFHVMTLLPGKLAGSFLGGAFEPLGDEVMLQIAEFLARLHAIPLDAYPRYLGNHPEVAAQLGSVESCYRFQIAQAREYQARVEFPPSPYLVYLFDWLDRHVPRDASPPVLVHGDC